MRKIIVNLCRLLLALTMIVSGFVKAVDPLGSQYKMQDYLQAMGLEAIDNALSGWTTLLAAILQAGFEFSVGIFLLFAIHRRLVTKLNLIFMSVMTALTVWIYSWNPVSDCGCFGDAIILTNGQTLLKNIILLAASAVVCRYPLQMPRLISKPNQWIVANYTYLFVLAICVYCLFDLPIFDFRPYHIGANIREGMEIPEGAPQPVFDTKLIYKKDGKQQTFTMDNLPDSTWTFVDSKSTMIEKGYEPPIHDFSIMAVNMEELTANDDITDEVLSDTSYTFLLVAPYLEKADETQFGNINSIADYAEKNEYRFICLTSSNTVSIKKWQDLTGAEYDFANCDPITLKTVIRSSPGLLLLKNGTVLQKWSHNRLPLLNDDTPALPKTQYGKMAQRAGLPTAGRLTFWYFVPLLILTLLDRLFAWTSWLIRRRNDKTNKNQESQQTNNQ